jgi:CRISPR/Cas system-associated endonuclease/helicase Cas3
MNLAELQTAFQGAVLNVAEPLPGSILPSRRQSAAERFEIYQDAYKLRLKEFLLSDYPALHMILGDDDFDSLALAYIEATSSFHRNARWYGRGLPDFMQLNEPWKDSRAVVDLASFERALADAFDAADSEAIEAATLGMVSAEDQPRLRFSFQPSLSLLILAQGVAAAHQAVNEDLEVSAPSDTEEETVLVWRDRSQRSFYRVLEENEALALDSARAGGTFAEICGLLSLRVPEETAVNEAAIFLIRWFADGLISGFSCV